MSDMQKNEEELAVGQERDKEAKTKTATTPRQIPSLFLQHNDHPSKNKGWSIQLSSIILILLNRKSKMRWLVAYIYIYIFD